MIWKPYRLLKWKRDKWPLPRQYGERARRMDAAIMPLFEPLLKTPEEYVREMEERADEIYKRQRMRDARRWLAVRRWYRNACDDDRREFEQRWQRFWPHMPIYAVYLVVEITAQRLGISMHDARRMLGLDDERVTPEEVRDASTAK